MPPMPGMIDRPHGAWLRIALLLVALAVRHGWVLPICSVPICCHSEESSEMTFIVESTDVSDCRLGVIGACPILGLLLLGATAAHSLGLR